MEKGRMCAIWEHFHNYNMELKIQKKNCPQSAQHFSNMHPSDRMFQNKP